MQFAISVVGCALGLWGLACANPAPAAPPELLWSTVDSGGGRVLGPDDLVLEGTIGQPDIGGGVVSTLEGRWGFWTDALCHADFNHDGTVNSTDMSDFSNAWYDDQSHSTLVTDWDGNGVINSADVAAFMNTWFADTAEGCG